MSSSQPATTTVEQDASFGVIPVRYQKGGWWLLVIQHRQGHWALPKGHPNPGESPYATASRELFEETQCRVLRFLEHPPLVEQYQFRAERRQISKTVTYFLAEAEGIPDPQLEELKAAAWFPIREAEQRVTFDQCRRMCQRIALYLQGKRPDALKGLADPQVSS